ncbi:YtxH domain-containing protein [Clostridium sp. Marseille-Q2269]|uniref:YtxH domain-containing protein n=1 Tax=Clostridium sp. Marseille-Q2269 TaxID=2942205 RepID=UPI0020744898|nr:YtxH domain-containing protein [Clostridium sp. Marseille-Q2269]
MKRNKSTIGKILGSTIAIAGSVLILKKAHQKFRCSDFKKTDYGKSFKIKIQDMKNEGHNLKNKMKDKRKNIKEILKEKSEKIEENINRTGEDINNIYEESKDKVEDTIDKVVENSKDFYEDFTDSADNADNMGKETENNYKDSNPQSDNL